MDTPLIDFDVAMDRLGDDKEFLIEMLHELVLQIEESHVPLKHSIESNDFTEFRHHAHGLKGAAANLNAERSAEIYKELEELARNGQVNGAGDLFVQAEKAKEDLKQYLDQL